MGEGGLEVVWGRCGARGGGGLKRGEKEVRMGVVSRRVPWKMLNSCKLH